MRRWIKRICIALVLFATGAGLVAWWAVRQTQHVPEFYTQAVTKLPAKTAEASMRLQADVEQFQSDAAKLGSWHATFSDQEINAWLAEELPKRFPQLLRSGVSDPRIVIEDDRLRVAARYKDRRFDTVVSMDLQAELTEEANMLAIRFTNVRAGALPLPIEQFLKQITHEAAKGDVDVRWDITEDGPVALVNVPREHPKYVVNPVIVESLQLADGELVLWGHTGPLAEESFKPHGQVHQFVSYQPNRSRQTKRLSSLASPRDELR